MNIDGRMLTWDEGMTCYSPGTSVNLPCSTMITVDNDSAYTLC